MSNHPFFLDPLWVSTPNSYFLFIVYTPFDSHGKHFLYRMSWQDCQPTRFLVFYGLPVSHHTQTLICSFYTGIDIHVHVLYRISWQDTSTHPFFRFDWRQLGQFSWLPVSHHRQTSDLLTGYVNPSAFSVFSNWHRLGQLTWLPVSHHLQLLTCWMYNCHLIVIVSEMFVYYQMPYSE